GPRQDRAVYARAPRRGEERVLRPACLRLPDGGRLAPCIGRVQRCDLSRLLRSAGRRDAKGKEVRRALSNSWRSSALGLAAVAFLAKCALAQTMSFAQPIM